MEEKQKPPESKAATQTYGTNNPDPRSEETESSSQYQNTGIHIESGSGNSSSISIDIHNRGSDDPIITTLDVLAKGTPPPTSGEPSPGRNHVSSSMVVRAEARDEKGTQPPSSGDSSSGRNAVGMSASVSVVSSESTGHDAGESKERTTSGSSHSSQQP